MPYIKQELRPPFDELILRYKSNFNWVFNTITDIIAEVDKQELTKQDGCMNYVLSKAFLLIQDVETVEILASLTIVTKYLRDDVISYFNIERARGLMESMSTEFMDRGWYERENGHDVFQAHQRMIGQLKGVQKNYEADKQRENGDII